MKDSHFIFSHAPPLFPQRTYIFFDYFPTLFLWGFAVISPQLIMVFDFQHAADPEQTI